HKLRSNKSKLTSVTERLVPSSPFCGLLLAHRFEAYGKTRTMNPENFFSELKRRNVYKVAVAYAVVGWVIAQIATQIFPFLEIPNWIVRLVIVLIAIGFPIALIIAWAFEATPEGIKRTEVADAMPTARSHKRHAWIFVDIV